MIDFCSYNVRGLNNKCSYIKDFISTNKVSLIGLLETKVNKDLASSISLSLSRNFQWRFNYDSHSHGRIWLGWDPSIWNISLISSNAQAMHCSVSRVESPTDCFMLSIIYAFNTLEERRSLWNDLSSFSQLVGDSSWCLCGDFNTYITPNENLGGAADWNNGMLEFKDCLTNTGLVDLKSVGVHLTWWNSSPQNPTYRKLDRVLVNSNWLTKFPLSLANFLQRGLSDHSPATVILGVSWKRIYKPFQFFNHLIDRSGFYNEIETAWGSTIGGDPWFILTSKLKLVKSAMIKLNKDSGNLHTNVETSRANLMHFQASMTANPSTFEYNEESRLSNLYSVALCEQETFLKQKSRARWVKTGDGNNSYFFNYCKGRWNLNKMLALEDDAGVMQFGHDNLASIAVDYYKDLLGTSSDVEEFPSDLTLPTLDENHIATLIKPVDKEEIYQTLKHMAKTKCPGPDGFTPEFFLATWSITGEDVCNGILHFFSTLHMPRIVNSVAIALIPKTPNAKSMHQYRPISCCNTLYKCIAKILSNRMKGIMADLISPNQVAFIPNRVIGDNILLAQALCKDYHLERGPPRCAIKLDLRKAFDTLNWGFLFKAMEKMRFPAQFLGWLKKCITTSMFSIKINGALEGYFPGKTGLRQGDPLSPYLFSIAMEVFSACLQEVTNLPDFQYHWQTEATKTTSLFFADDVLLFAKGEEASIRLLLDGVNKFAAISGLKPNPSKCSCFFSNVPLQVIHNITRTSGFSWGDLPVTYLGLPLITSSLTKVHCQPLIMKICLKLQQWYNIFLSFAGRLQLIKTVLMGIFSYWSAHIFLPVSTLKEIQAKCARFLWAGSNATSCHFKVSWKDCCLPKNEGGLGLRDLKEWNLATTLFQLWRLLQPNSPSLWVQWFNGHILRDKPFWTFTSITKLSWSIKKIFQVRDIAMRFIKFHIGGNSRFLLWHDPWLIGKPLIQHFGVQLISIMESTNLATVNSIIRNSLWVPHGSNHVLAIEMRQLLLNVRILSRDNLSWNDDTSQQVSISTIWDSIRRRTVSPPWLQILWHSLHIPKCSFILWLALKNRLLTFDRMLQFGMNVDPHCKFCTTSHESAQHLLLHCSYTQQIFINSPLPIGPDWISDIQDTSPNITLKINYLFIGAAFYHIWLERNSRVHSNSSKPTRVLVQSIKQMVRDKVHGCKQFQKLIASNPSLTSLLY